MKPLISLTDPIYEFKKLTKLDVLFLRYIRDERDLPFVYLIFKTTLLLPIAILLYLPCINLIWWSLAIAFQIINIKYRTSFGLMIHAISHRKLFRKRYNQFTLFINWILCPLLGHTPNTYYSHHIGMHHPEGNMPNDNSSTMYYQRDSITDFIKYVIKFLFTGLIGLFKYLKKNNRKKLAYKAIIGEMSFCSICIILFLLNWQATIIVFIFTFCVSRILMMFGNWTQHAFVDPNNPENPYKNSINCLNIRHNHIAWNDGYHSSHHLNPTLHWTEHPIYFIKNNHNYARHKSVIFDGLTYPKIFFYLVCKRYDLLSKYFINLNDSFRCDEEIISLLKERTKKFPKPARRSVRVSRRMFSTSPHLF